MPSILNLHEITNLQYRGKVLTYLRFLQRRNSTADNRFTFCAQTQKIGFQLVRQSELQGLTVDNQGKLIIDSIQIAVLITQMIIYRVAKSLKVKVNFDAINDDANSGTSSILTSRLESFSNINDVPCTIN